MAYDEALDARIVATVKPWGATRKRMFGGTCHLLDGNMLCGVHDDSLIVRLGAEAGDDALTEPHTRLMNVTGKPMKGWVMVGPGGCGSQEELVAWLDKARAFAMSLPPK